MNTAIVIREDGTTETFEFDASDSYDKIKTAIGGWIDGVSGPEGVYGYVDDEGLLTGRPLNLAASTFFQRVLVGPCVIMGDADEEGDSTGLTPGQVAFFKDFARQFEGVYRYADRAGITLRADPGDGSRLMTFEVVE